ncbi:carbohydrate kinase family protein [Negadavirga shengliensis]|uniref:Carbohydrate kinase n=1 Tax=Negadavirga shengliensis TaxID=1389218 RepID=A0ABV9SY19_9BACT
MDKKIVCFGEMLWDIFPKQKIAGGAPMNVALHLQHLGYDVTMVSRIGTDKLGRKLLSFIKKYGLHEGQIQTDLNFPTGSVIVDDSDKENIKYEIVSPAAWDHIEWTSSLVREIQMAEAFIYGSLAARNEESRNTLYRLLQTDTLKVFDINLRPPFYKPGVLEVLLQRADILKINEDELVILADYYALSNKMDATLEKLTEMFDLQLICVTLGAKGAVIYQDGEIIRHPGYPVEVRDTVGSGDAFLAGFVNKYLEKETPEKTLDFACALGALVATFDGGTPQYSLEQIEAIRHE